MRYYRVVRDTRFLQFTEQVAKPSSLEHIAIPSTIPKLFDPVICWKHTENKRDVTQLYVRDISHSIWFAVKSSHSLNKLMEAYEELEKELR
jgi:hypothetical protein